MLIVTLAEAIPVHILVARWSPEADWLLTNLAAYGLFWFVADYRATRLRPILLDAETLCIRTGLRWTIRIPRAHIVAIHEKAPQSEPFLRATLPRVKPLWIELAEPVTAQGLYGIEKQARWISVAVDDAKAFQEAIPGTAGIPAAPSNSAFAARRVARTPADRTGSDSGLRSAGHVGAGDPQTPPFPRTRRAPQAGSKLAPGAPPRRSNPFDEPMREAHHILDPGRLFRPDIQVNLNISMHPSHAAPIDLPGDGISVEETFEILGLGSPDPDAPDWGAVMSSGIEWCRRGSWDSLCRARRLDHNRKHLILVVLSQRSSKVFRGMDNPPTTSLNSG